MNQVYRNFISADYGGSQAFDNDDGECASIYLCSIWLSLVASREFLVSFIRKLLVLVGWG